MSGLWNALRPPAAVSQVTLPPPAGERNAVVTLSERDVIVANDDPPALSTLLLVEPSSSPIVFDSIVRTLQQARPGSVAMALSGRFWPVPQTARRRWSELSSTLSIKQVELASAGWTRIDLEHLSSRLDELFFPAALLESDRVIVLPGQNQSSPFDLWRHLVHPHSRLRASASRHRDQLAAELAAAVPAEYAFRLDISNPGRGSDLLHDTVTIWTNDIVAARLIWLCAQAFRSNDEEIERKAPWEDAQVQAAAELGIGVQTGAQLLLQPPTRSEAIRSFVTFTESKLGCQVSYVD